jgi:hypothetical protein
MELFRIVAELWRRKVLVAVALVLAVLAALAATYRLSVFPPKLEDKAFSVATAQTQFIVAARQQPLTDVTADLGALNSRASIFARLMQSEPVMRRTSEESGIERALISSTGPVAGDAEQNDGAQNESARVQQLVAEGRSYRISFKAVEGEPIVTVFAQGPDVDGAERLANGAVTAISQYLSDDLGDVSAEVRVGIQQLGKAEGGLVRSEGARPAVAVVAFLAVFGSLCLLIVLLSGAWSRWRDEQTAQAFADDWDEAIASPLFTEDSADEPHRDAEAADSHPSRVA